MDSYAMPNKSHSTVHKKKKNFDFPGHFSSRKCQISQLDPENCQKVNLFNLSLLYNKSESYFSLAVRITSPNFGLPKAGVSKLSPGGPLSCCAVSEIAPYTLK